MPFKAAEICNVISYILKQHSIFLFAPLKLEQQVRLRQNAMPGSVFESLSVSPNKFREPLRRSSSGVGPLPVINGLNVMRANRHSFARTDAAMPKRLSSPAETPTPGCQIATLLCSEEIVCGTKELQQSLVAPDVTAFVWRGEAAVASVPSQEQEEMGVTLKQLQR